MALFDVLPPGMKAPEGMATGADLSGVGEESAFTGLGIGKPAEPVSLPKEAGKAIVRGIGGVGEMGAHLVKLAGAEETGKALEESSAALSEKFAMHPELQKSFAARGILGGLESMPASVSAGIPGAIVGAKLGAAGGSAVAPGPGTLLGGIGGGLLGYALSGASLMGLSEYQNYLDEYEKEFGKTPDSSVKASAALSGLAEGGFEGLSDLIGGAVVFKPVLASGAHAIRDIIRAPFKKGAKEFLKDYGKIAATETGTEMATAAGEAYARQREGMETPGIGEAVKESIIPALTMSTLFMGGGTLIQKHRMDRIEKSLEDPTISPEERVRAAQDVDQLIQASNVDPATGKLTDFGAQMSQAWKDYALQSVKNGQAIDLDKVLDPQALQIETGLAQDPAAKAILDESTAAVKAANINNEPVTADKSLAKEPAVFAPAAPPAAPAVTGAVETAAAPVIAPEAPVIPPAAAPEVAATETKKKKGTKTPVSKKTPEKAPEKAPEKVAEAAPEIAPEITPEVVKEEAKDIRAGIPPVFVGMSDKNLKTFREANPTNEWANKEFAIREAEAKAAPAAPVESAPKPVVEKAAEAPLAKPEKVKTAAQGKKLIAEKKAAKVAAPPIPPAAPVEKGKPNAARVIAEASLAPVNEAIGKLAPEIAKLEKSIAAGEAAGKDMAKKKITLSNKQIHLSRLQSEADQLNKALKESESLRQEEAAPKKKVTTAAKAKEVIAEKKTAPVAKKTQPEAKPAVSSPKVQALLDKVSAVQKAVNEREKIIAAKEKAGESAASFHKSQEAQKKELNRLKRELTAATAEEMKAKPAPVAENEDLNVLNDSLKILNNDLKKARKDHDEAVRLERPPKQVKILAQTIEDIKQDIADTQEEINKLTGEPKLTRAPEEAKGMSVEYIMSVVDRIKSKMANPPPIEVIPGMNTLLKSGTPEGEALKSYMEDKDMLDENGEDRRTLGLVWKGKMYIIAENHTSEEEVLRTYAHELTHNGLGAFFDRVKAPGMGSIRLKYEILMDKIWQAHKAEVENIVATTHQQYDLDVRTDRRKACEEWLCNQTYDAQPKWYDRLVAIFNDILRVLGIDTKLTDAEVRTVLSDSFRTFGSRAIGSRAMAPAFSRIVWIEPNIEKQVMSTRVPTAKNASEDPLMDNLFIDYRVTVADQDSLEKNLDALDKTPNVRYLKGAGAKGTVRRLEAFLDHAVSNLLFLHGLMPKKIKNRAKLWYDGGNKIVKEWGNRYGISDMQASGIIAVMSPQKDWYTNVSISERTADIYFGVRDVRWDEAMDNVADEITKEGRDQEVMDRAKGKTLAELDGDTEAQARWIRVYDQAHNNRSYRILTPEGGTGDYVKTTKGMNASAAWGSYSTIAKAISILKDGTAENIHYQLGGEHKVRSFYNNLLHPNNPVGFATIDTHAVAADFLRPLSGNDQEVAQSFGTGKGASSSSITGQNGLYPIHYEAYRRAAKEVDLLPREMQSIAWEGVRGLFERGQKQYLKERAESIWMEYKRDRISQEEAQQQILEMAGGMAEPTWAGIPFNDTIGRTYEGASQKAIDKKAGPEGIAKAKLPKIFLEVAPDPDDAVRVSIWNSLSDDAKNEITNRVISRIVPKVLSEVGTRGFISVQIGGFEGATSPSIAVSLDRPEQAIKAAKLLGYALSQKSMMVVSDTKIAGADPVGVVTIVLPEGYGHKEIKELYDRLWTLEKDGQKLVGGHSTANGKMAILNFTDLDTRELGDIINTHLGNDFDVRTNTVFASYPEKKDYDYAIDRREGTATGRPSVQRNANLLREEADSILREEFAQRGAPSFSRRAEPAERVRPAGKRVERKGVTRSSGQELIDQGTHYSNQQRDRLDSKFYGTGLADAASRRLPSDPKSPLRQRIHFYYDPGTGMPKAEVGVGAYAHNADLSKYKIYNLTSGVIKVDRVEGEHVLNTFEKAIMKAGFDGFSSPDYGVVVLIGKRTVPVEPVEPQFSRVAESPREVDKFFREDDLQTLKDSNPLSRSFLIYMPINDFLKMAKVGYAEEKETRVEKMIKEGEKFSIPSLRFDNKGEKAEVTGHEGRHRARALRRMGYTDMPVEFVSAGGNAGAIRWGQQMNPANKDYKIFPKQLIGENGTTAIDFPVTREMVADRFEPQFSRVPKETDARYLELAKDPEKNKAELQKMVDEAAKAAGYNVEAWHGTENSEYSVFDETKIGSASGNHGFLGKGFYFFAEKNFADYYGKSKRFFLSMRNPLVLEGKMDTETIRKINKASDTWAFSEGDTADNVFNGFSFSVPEFPDLAEKISTGLQDMGHDGVIYKSGETAKTEIVAYSPTQIKSADPVTRDSNGNVIPLSERFNPEEPDIRFTRAPANAAPASVPPGNNATWNASGPSPFKTFFYTMIDKQVDLRETIKDIEKFAGTIKDTINASLKEILYSGRVAALDADFLDYKLRPIYNDLARRNIDITDFEEYLWYRHAKEANAYVRTISDDDGNIIGMQDKGSGKTDQETDDYFAALSPSKQAVYEEFARKVDVLTRENAQLMVDYQLESQAVVDKWLSKYKHYVPLFREHIEDARIGTGSGLTVTGSVTRRRKGSEKPVVDILANIAMQHERIIASGEKNKIATAIYALAKNYPNEQFWKVVKPPMRKTIDMATKEPVWVPDPNYKKKDNVVMSRQLDGGKIVERGVEFNMEGETPRRMAASLRNIDMDTLGMVLGTSARVTRFIASMNTQWNPIFGVTNFVRDVGTAMFNLTTTPIAGRQREVMSHAIPAMKGVWEAVRAQREGQRPTSEWGKLFNEFQMMGGQTGYRDLFKTSRERSERIDKEMREAMAGKTVKLGFALRDLISDYNTSMENAIRLASYKTGIDRGMSKEQAAAMAKSLTVNFNRKGQIATQAGALYAFFNATAQGAAKVYETLTGPAGKKIIWGGLMFGVLQAAMLAAAGMKEDEPPEFVQEKNIIIPIGGGKYATIPMPLGFNVLPNIGRMSAQFAMGGFKDPFTKMANLFGVILDGFNPLGASKTLLQTISPTPIDPLVALAENKDWTGKPIYREDFSSLHPTPGFTRTKDTATWGAKGLAWGLNMLTGGTRATPGFLSPTPDMIDYLVGQATGGVGREFGKVQQVAQSLATGEELPAYKVPLTSRFYGTVTGEANEGTRYYNNLKLMNRHEDEIKDLIKHREPIREYLSENPEARLWHYSNSVESTISKLKKRKSELIARNADPRTVKAIDALMRSHMKRFNERVEAAKG